MNDGWESSAKARENQYTKKYGKLQRECSNVICFILNQCTLSERLVSFGKPRWLASHAYVATGIPTEGVSRCRAWPGRACALGQKKM